DDEAGYFAAQAEHVRVVVRQEQLQREPVEVEAEVADAVAEDPRQGNAVDAGLRHGLDGGCGHGFVRDRPRTSIPPAGPARPPSCPRTDDTCRASWSTRGGARRSTRGRACSA